VINCWTTHLLLTVAFQWPVYVFFTSNEPLRTSDSQPFVCFRPRPEICFRTWIVNLCMKFEDFHGGVSEEYYVSSGVVTPCSLVEV
jgi:hypothetical protein